MSENGKDVADMKKWLCLVLVVMMLAPGVCRAGEQWFVDGKTSDRVLLREEPSGDAPSPGLFFTGTIVKPTGKSSGDYVEVQVGRSTGYMHRDYISSDVASYYSQFQSYQVAHPTSTWVHLRRGPHQSQESLGRYDNGTPVTLMGELAFGWSYVLVDGQEGYMMTDLLAPAEPEEPIDPGIAHTEIVGRTAEGAYIHAFSAENGQTLYFDAWEEDVYMVRMEVNFDDVPDLAFTQSRGASNTYYNLFVCLDGKYQPVQVNGMEYPLVNFGVDPERQLVVSHANNGNAGALHETRYFRWDGAELNLVLLSSAENYVETSYQDNRHTETHFYDMYRLRVECYDSSEFSDFDCVYTSDEVMEMLADEQAALDAY